MGEQSCNKLTDRSKDTHKSSRLYFPYKDDDIESLRHGCQDRKSDKRRFAAAPVRNIIVEVPRFNSDSDVRSSSSQSDNKEDLRHRQKAKGKEDRRLAVGTQGSQQPPKSHLFKTSRDEANVMKPILHELNSRVLMSYQDRESSTRASKKHGSIFNTYDHVGDASLSRSKDFSKERTYAMRASRDSRESDCRPLARPVLKPKRPIDQSQEMAPKKSTDRRPSLATSKIPQDRSDAPAKLSMQTKVFQVNVVSRRQPSKVCCPNCYNIFAPRDSYPTHEKHGNELSFRPLDSPKTQHWNRFNNPSSTREDQRPALGLPQHQIHSRPRQESKENLFRNEHINQSIHNY